MMRYTALLLIMLLAACGGGGKKDVVDNPYSDRMKELTRTGVDAMQRERWQVAESLFNRALQAAQLASDQQLIGQAWYNLGVLHAAAGDDEKAEEELMKADGVSELHSQPVTLMRTRVALAILHQKQGRQAWQAEQLGSNMPLDLHLSVARLAQLQKRYEVSQNEYAYVLHKGGDDRNSRLYMIDAHMGLALLQTELGQKGAALTEVAEVLRMSRETGAPRLAAHANLLAAKLSENEAGQLASLRDALAIYEALEDSHGQKDVLNMLIKISVNQGDTERAELYRQKLDRVNAPVENENGETKQ